MRSYGNKLDFSIATRIPSEESELSEDDDELLVRHKDVLAERFHGSPAWPRVSTT
jgi:hypothetical protein